MKDFGTLSTKWDVSIKFIPLELREPHRREDRKSQGAREKMENNTHSHTYTQARLLNQHDQKPLWTHRDGRMHQIPECILQLPVQYFYGIPECGWVALSLIPSLGLFSLFFYFFSFLFNFFCPVLSCLVFVWYYILLFKNVIIKKEKCRKRSFKIRACRHEVQMVECLTTSFRQLKKW